METMYLASPLDSVAADPVPAAVPEPQPVRRRKPRVWTPFVALLLSLVVGNLIGAAIMIALVIASLASSGVPLEQGFTPEQYQTAFEDLFAGSLLGAVIAILAFQLTMAAVTLAAAKLSRVPLKLRLGLRKPRMSGRGWIALALSSLATISIALFITVGIHLLLPLDESASPLVLDDPSFVATLVLSLLVSLVPAFVEEFFFRGYMQRRLLQRWSPSVAIGVTTMLFALIHMDSVHHIISVIPIGLLLGIVAYRTRSVWPGVVLHMLHNALACILGAVFASALTTMTEEAAGMVVLSVLGSMLLIGAVAVFHLVFRPIRLPAAGLLETEPADLATADELSVQRINRMPEGAVVDDPLKVLSA